ncbi:hypothetical protein OSTOST_02795 [Ostertagia ostertagi]
MDRKFKLAVITRVERHPEIWNFTSEDYKKQDDTFSKRLKHYPPGAAKAWVYDDELQFLMTSTSAGTCSSVTEPDEEEPAQDVKGKHFDKEGSVTTEDGFTDSSSVSIASPSYRKVKRSNGPAGTERTGEYAGSFRHFRSIYRPDSSRALAGSLFSKDIRNHHGPSYLNSSYF